MSPRFAHLPAESWSLYLDDRLEGEARARVEAHAAGCEPCRSALLAADPTRAFRLAAHDARPDWDGFWEELRPQLGPPAARRPRLGRIAVSLAAAAGLLAGSWLVLSQREPPPPPDPCAAPEIARLHLTKAECEDLFREIEAEESQVIVVRELDLRDIR